MYIKSKYVQPATANRLNDYEPRLDSDALPRDAGGPFERSKVPSTAAAIAAAAAADVLNKLKPFSKVLQPDVKLTLCIWQGEIRVDIRRYHNNVPTRRGVSLKLKQWARLQESWDVLAAKLVVKTA